MSIQLAEARHEAQRGDALTSRALEEALVEAAALAAREAELALVVTWSHPQNREWEQVIDALVDLRQALSDLGGDR